VAEANLICMPAFRSLKAPAPSVRIKNAVAKSMIVPANTIAKIMSFPSGFVPPDARHLASGVWLSSTLR